LRGVLAVVEAAIPKVTREAVGASPGCPIAIARYLVLVGRGLIHVSCGLVSIRPGLLGVRKHLIVL
jgi:hypothetical protein